MRLRDAARSLQKHPLLRYGAAALISSAAVLARLALNPILNEQGRYGFLLPATLVCAIYGGFGAGLFACLLGALLTMRFVVQPDDPFRFDNPSDVGGLVLFLAINLGVLFLAHRETKEKRRRIRTERQLEELNAELERKVEERTAQLKRANEELEGFCYSMAHDLRTPSRAIAGNARILMEDHSAELTPELQNHLRRINGAALKLGALLDGLLTYARLATQDLQLKLVRVDELAKEIAVEEARRIRAELLVESEPLEVLADERQLRVMLRALIDNSLVYRKIGEPARLSLTLDEGALVVSDNGIGFDMAFAHKVFVPFERLHRDEAYPGVGIGLANVERVATRHGGSVSIESAPNQGTQVKVCLPGIAKVPAKPEAVAVGAS
jgi:signal transduction histidine kinase